MSGTEPRESTAHLQQGLRCLKPVAGAAASYHDRQSARRGERDAAAFESGGVTGNRFQFDAREDLGQNDFHLIGRESRAYTSARPTAEREECVRVDSAAEKPLGVELQRVLPQVTAAMGKVDAR